MQNSSSISLIYGIDFSVLQEACKKIWICESIPTDEGLKVQKCWNIKEKYGNISLNNSLKKLTEFIASNPGAAFGLDFPFGLPKIIVDESNWIAFIRKFPEYYNDPYEFRQKCQDRALELTGKKN